MATSLEIPDFGLTFIEINMKGAGERRSGWVHCK